MTESTIHWRPASEHDGWFHDGESYVIMSRIHDTWEVRLLFVSVDGSLDEDEPADVHIADAWGDVFDWEDVEYWAPGTELIAGLPKEDASDE